MMTGADRQRPPILFAAVAVLALSGAVLGLLFSPLQAQEGTAPDKPRGLEATATHGQVTLTWDDPNDDTITGYVILRRVRVNNTGGEFSELVPDTGTAAATYTDDTVAASTTYTYRIKAINEHGVSERSRWFHIDTLEAPQPEEEQAAEPPAQPTGLTAEATHDTVTLTWDDPQDDSITGYVVLRRIPAVDPEGQFRELVSDTGTAATTYTDGAVSAETRYTYRIKAINEHGVSERSRWFHIDTPAAPSGSGKRANVSEPEGEDLPSDGSTFGEVEVGGSVTGYAGGRDTDRDWFRVVLQAGVRYQIDLEGKATQRGSLEEPTLRLTSSAGQQGGSYTEGNREGIQKNSRIIQSYSGDGPRTRYLRVGRSGGNDDDKRGTYTLSVIALGDGKSEGASGASTDNDDFPNSNSTPGKVVVGASATGWIDDNDGEEDAFRIELKSGKWYQIDVGGEETGRGSLEHVKMRLMSRDYKTELARDYSSGNSSVTVVPRSGRYFVEVRGDEKGSYTVSVRDVTPPEAPDLPASTETTGVVAVDRQAVRGFISEPEGRHSTDTDWFAVELEKDRTYRIEMKGAILYNSFLYSDPELTLRLPQINAIYDRHGNQLVNMWGRDESSAHHLFRVTYHARHTRTLYIAVSGESWNWGGYELRVKDITEDD